MCYADGDVHFLAVAVFASGTRVARSTSSTHAAADTSTAGAASRRNNAIQDIDRTCDFSGIALLTASTRSTSLGLYVGPVIVSNILIDPIGRLANITGSRSLSSDRANTSLAADACAAVAAGYSQLTVAFSVRRSVNGQRRAVRHIDTGGHAVVGIIRRRRGAAKVIVRIICNDDRQTGSACHLDR